MRRALLFVVFALVSISAKALWFEQDGIYYETRTDGVWVMPNKYKGDIVIPSTVTYKGIEYTVVGIGSAFTNRPEVTSVTIPNTVTTLGEFSFQACGLTSIIIPNSVTVIGGAAFQECNNLESVTIGNGVDSIGTAAFRNCTSLKSISIPGNVTKLGNAAFKDCNNLTTITIGNGIKTIGESAFNGCKRLTSVVIPNSVTSIGTDAFRECTSLSSVVMQNSDNSETSIGECAFWHCKSLASIDFSNSLTSIGKKAFEGCTSLASINLPNSLTSIEKWAFKDCTSLTSIDIPNKVTSISCHLCYGCTNLKTMSVDRNIETFYGCSISECKNLTSLVCKNPNPPKLGPLSDFDYIVLNTILYVPKGSEEAYKKAEGWKHFGTIKAIGEDDKTDNTNTDDTTTDDSNTDDNIIDNTNTDDTKEGWSVGIKIKDKGVVQYSTDEIESIDFSEDGLYIVINFKDGNSAKYDMSKFESIDFTDNSSKDDGINLNQDYDVLKINGVDYACYGYRCAITYTSTWDSAKHSGEFRLPCGLLSEAQNGKYEYNFMYIIYLKGKENLKIGSKLEDYSPTFENMSDWSELDYVSGSATITDKQNDKYITVKFDSFKFGDGSNSYTLNGSVQLKFDE